MLHATIQTMNRITALATATDDLHIHIFIGLFVKKQIRI